MNHSPDDSKESAGDRRGLLKLALIALAVGAMTGIAGAPRALTLLEDRKLRKT